MRMPDAEMNKVITQYFDKLLADDLSAETKKIIEEQADKISYKTKVRSYSRAKIGKASSLEILYKLGRYLNKIDYS